MRKNWLVLFPALLLFCGCSAQKPETIPADVTSPTVFTTEPTEPVGFYQPDSAVEVFTDGAIQVFPLDIPDVAGYRFLGEDILLFSGNDRTTLTLLGGNRRYVKAQLELSCAVSAEDPAVVVSSRGVTYVDPETHALVFLNESLKDVSRIPLPEECESPVLSQNRSKLYYCTVDGLRVLDLETGIDRMLKEMRFPSQKLLGLHCDDTVIQCCATFDDGGQHMLFFQADNGSLLYETAELIPLWTQGDTYFATHMNGAYQELITGSRRDEPMLLVPEADYDGMAPILSQNMLLMHRQNEYGQTVLDCYSLESGLHFAQAVFPGNYPPRGIQDETSSGNLWFLCSDSSNEQDLLCAWDPSRSDTNNGADYLQPRYDQDNPDLEGLDACKLLARDISIRHDVQIFIWHDATAFQPWDYTLVPEYQAPLIRRKLLQLDEILSSYPAGFLKEAASQTGNGRLTICLVRSINGNPNTNALESAVGLQYWDQDARAYLAITPGDDMARHIYHELFHIIDSRVLSSCSAYDNWNKLNPKGFSYGSGTSAQNLISGDNRYFIDFYSTRYAKEDRARIMEYAMLDGQQEVFQPEPIQAKLRQLCQGIREAFGLENEAEVYRWEQYLHTPLSSGT